MLSSGDGSELGAASRPRTRGEDRGRAPGSSPRERSNPGAEVMSLDDLGSPGKGPPVAGSSDFMPLSRTESNIIFEEEEGLGMRIGTPQHSSRDLLNSRGSESCLKQGDNLPVEQVREPELHSSSARPLSDDDGATSNLKGPPIDEPQHRNIPGKGGAHSTTTRGDGAHWRQSDDKMRQPMGDQGPRGVSGGGALGAATRRTSFTGTAVSGRAGNRSASHASGPRVEASAKTLQVRPPRPGGSVGPRPQASRECSRDALRQPSVSREGSREVATRPPRGSFMDCKAASAHGGLREKSREGVTTPRIKVIESETRAHP